MDASRTTNSPEYGLCPICDSQSRELLFFYNSPPEGELSMNIAEQQYERRVIYCKFCGHCSNHFGSQIEDLYSRRYTDVVYGDLAGLEASFHRIRSLPPHNSDNYGRTEFVCEAVTDHFLNAGRERQTLRLLDVGAGIGIFVYEMTSRGFSCVALDPDTRNCQHIEQSLGVNVIHSNYEEFFSEIQFDIISFNKILEHVRFPSKLLNHAYGQLTENGVVYVEVPDATSAKELGGNREEFFSDHFHIFSMRSAIQLISQCGFRIISALRLREPSGKFTIRIFAKIH